MTAYTVHEPADAPAALAARADRAAFVKEGIAWVALFLPVIWLLYHRMWLVLAGFVAVMAAIYTGLAVAGIGDPAAFLCTLTVSILFAVQANDLRRWSLARRGYRLTAALAGDDLTECELKYFTALAGGDASAAASAAPPAKPALKRKPAAGEGDEIIGLFPDKA